MIRGINRAKRQPQSVAVGDARGTSLFRLRDPAISSAPRRVKLIEQAVHEHGHDRSADAVVALAVVDGVAVQQRRAGGLAAARRIIPAARARPARRARVPNVRARVQQRRHERALAVPPAEHRPAPAVVAAVVVAAVGARIARPRGRAAPDLARDDVEPLQQRVDARRRRHPRARERVVRRERARVGRAAPARARAVERLGRGRLVPPEREKRASASSPTAPTATPTGPTRAARRRGRRARRPRASA